MERGVVLRAGELFLKGRNRPFFEKALADHIEAVLKRHGPLKLSRGQGRFFVTGGEPAGLVAELTQIFGIATLSPVIYVDKDLDLIGKICLDIAQRAVAEGITSFRVTTRRPDKRFPLSSPQVNAAIGAIVVEATGLAVNLAEPELEIGLELGPKLSFIYSEVIPGARGLPVGVSGEALLLLSGGIDSPVAGYLGQKRGLRLRAIHFHAAPWTSAASQEKVRQLAANLARRQAGIELHQVPFGPVQDQIRTSTDDSYRVILYRRSMVRIAQRIAESRSIKALVTGESLGQVASQTLDNMACIEDATDLLVLRPLVGFDKVDVMDLARKIGTYETSIQPHDDCCSLFVPKHPQTKGKVSFVRRLERKLELEALIDQAIEETEVELIEG
jgi:thiamine biosynthesis protein ThiI